MDIRTAAAMMTPDGRTPAERWRDAELNHDGKIPASIQADINAQELRAVHARRLPEYAAKFQAAERDGLWFYANIAEGKIWFSPDELRAEHAQGNYIWPAANWRLRDPNEFLVAAESDYAIAKKDADHAKETLDHVRDRIIRIASDADAAIKDATS